MERVLRWNEEVLVKNPFEDKIHKPTLYLGLIHAHVYLEDKKGNLDNARRLVYLASEQHLDTLIFPYMQPYGPIIKKNLTKNYIRKKYGLSFASGYLYNLNIVAKNYGINIMIPGVVEKTGSKLYISAVYMHGTIGEEPEKYRKIIMYEEERKIGFNKGKTIKLFTIRKTPYNILLDGEILYPELARLYAFLGSKFMVVALSPANIVKNYISVLKTLAQMIKLPILFIGGTYYDGNRQLLFLLPTMIINEKGDIIFKHHSEEQVIVQIPVHALDSGNKYIIDKSLEFIYKLSFKIITGKARGRKWIISRK